MEKVSRRKQAVLDVLDEEIAELEAKLQKVQPLIDELATLRATRARLLDERSLTSGGGRGGARVAQLTMETVILDLQQNGASTPIDMAARIGVTESTVRSHLNRYRDQRYRQNGNGEWSLIGEDDEDEGDDE